MHRFTLARRYSLAFAIALFSLLVNDSNAAPDSNTLQRSVLYEEDPSNAAGNKYDGTVLIFPQKSRQG